MKGYKVSRPYKRKKILPRQWIPKFWWPALKKMTLYSEILDRFLSVVVTERTLRLIDGHYGFDSYILRTPEIDLCSTLGNKLKREMLCALADGLPNVKEEEKRIFLLKKHDEFQLPRDEAEWVGLDLNEACRKLQDLEEDEQRAAEVPKKILYEKDMVRRLSDGSLDDGDGSWLDTAEKFLGKIGLRR